MVPPGAGGYGDPKARDPALMARDVAEGKVSARAARELYGHDENFEPQCTDDFSPTHAPSGSKQKIDVLAERIQRGMPLWHPEDSTDSSADMLVGAGR
jgi:hypothetical protein